MSNIQDTFQQALAAHQQGNLPEAESLYRQVLDEMPSHFDTLHLLGVLHAQQRRFGQGMALIQRAIAENPFHAGAHSNLGNAQVESGLLLDALASYDRALSLMPEYPDALFNKGNALKKLKHFDEALDSYNKVLALAPSHADALINRGNALQELGRNQEALTSYEAALATQPRAVNALVSYSHLQHKLGNTAAALQAATTALAVENSINTQSTFFNVVKGVEIAQQPSVLWAPLLVRAMSEPWGRPHELTPTMVNLIQQDPAIQQCLERTHQAWPHMLSMDLLFIGNNLLTVCRNPYLLCLLENTNIPDIDLEKFLTLTRYALLQHAAGIPVTQLVDSALLNFHCALARQCFINEYVFYCSEAELEQAHTLVQQLESALLADAPVPSLWIAAVACYFPLFSLACTKDLYRITAAAPITSLL